MKEDEPSRIAEQHAESNRSIPGLMRHFVSEVTALLRDEVTLAKREVKDNISGLKGGLMSVIGGAIVLIAGLVVLLDAVVLVLTDALPEAPLWLPPLIVGVVVLAIGGIMLAAGRNKLNAGTLVPDQTMAENQRDWEVLRERTT